MNKTELIAVVAEKTGLSKNAADAAVAATFDAIKATLKKGGKVQLFGFGTFEVRKRAARTGLNPQTKQPIKIKASKAPVFKAAKAFKEAL